MDSDFDFLDGVDDLFWPEESDAPKKRGREHAALGFSEDIARAKVQQVLDGEPGLADVETILKRALAPG